MNDKADNKVVSYDVVELMRRDRAVFARRLQCISYKRIAEEFHITVEEAHEAVARMTHGISPALRDEMRKEEIDRMDELQSHWWEKAKTDYEALMAVMKISDYRARLTGLLQSPSADSNFEERIRDREKSTVALRRQLEGLIGRSVEQVIEGEATHVDEAELADAGDDPTDKSDA